MNENTLQINELNKALELTDSIINRKYLAFLTDSRTYRIRRFGMNEAIDVEKLSRIFHMKKFIYDTNESFLSKMITVVNVAYALKGTIVTTIKSRGDRIDFYFGIAAKEKRDKRGEKDREALLNAFEGTILGNFGGSELERLTRENMDDYVASINGKAVCAVSVVPSLRSREDNKIVSYVQGIENLVDSLKGKNYTIITIADPVSSSDIAQIRHGYEKVYNYLAPLHKVVETKGTSETVSLSRADTENYVKGITDGIARTQSRSESVNYTNGFNLGASFIVSAGFNHSKSRGTSNSDAVSQSSSVTEQTGTSRSRTESAGHISSESTQVSVENRMIKSMLDKIEKNMERIDECEGYGAFNAATYVLADDKETALNAAGNFISLMKGERTASQTSGINCWEWEPQPEYPAGDRREQPPFETILKHLQHFMHPAFFVNDAVSVSASTMVSGPELTVQLGLPKKSINGVVVLPMHPFGRNVRKCEKRNIRFGRLDFMGRLEAQDVCVEMDTLASHTFVTGSTGKGKSNAIYGMISRLAENNVKFMVIEPAKGEYKGKLGMRDGVITFVTNPNFSAFISESDLNKMDVRLLRINPFRFPASTHVLEHIDRLTGAFNVCWPMYAAMPAILKDAVERAYAACGWDLENSANKYGEQLFPTFADVIGEIKEILDESEYSADNKGDYIGSLSTRLKSLTTGLNGLMLSADDWEDELLFDTNAIIDLSRIGSPDTKSLIMGLLVIKLQEYRMQSSMPDSPLKHVTVIEEAHNLLKKTSLDQSQESANMAGKSVEMLSNAIAEMRTYGEGFIIADQSPGMLDKAVIRNTNTKILLNLPDYEDRLIVGRAAGLSDDQINELAKLEKGVAAVSQSDWLEPVLCKFDKYDEKSFVLRHEEVRKDQAGPVDTEKLKKDLAACIMTQEIYLKGDRVSIGRLKENALRSRMHTGLKCAYLDYLSARKEERLEKLRVFAYQFFGAEHAVNASKASSDIVSWVHAAAEHLSPGIQRYSSEQIDRLIALVIQEQAINYAEYTDIQYRFIEMYEKEGGVF